MTIEIVDFPIKHGDIFPYCSFLYLPEGKPPEFILFNGILSGWLNHRWSNTLGW